MKLSPYKENSNIDVNDYISKAHNLRKAVMHSYRVKACESIKAKIEHITSLFQTVKVA